jgi:predicted PurR-regulated permease PerM
MEPSAPHQDLKHAAREAAVFWSIAVLGLALVIVLHTAAQILLLTFAGFLFGTTLRGAAEWISKHTKIGAGWTLVTLVLVLVLLAVMAFLWIVPHVVAQSGELWKKLVQAVEDLRKTLDTSDFGRELVDSAYRLFGWLRQHAAVAAGFVFGVVGGIAAAVYVIVVALYYAADPGLYRRGIIVLFPEAHRRRAGEVLDELELTLRRWLWSRVVAMAALGIATTIALWLLGIPMAEMLGLLAGLALFVPYLGSIASAIPALLIALTVSPMYVLWVAIVYVVLHLAEGYVVTPPLTRKFVETPSLLVLFAQLAAGVLWGLLGATLATPLLAAVLILVRMLWVEDVLHDEVTNEQPLKK